MTLVKICGCKTVEHALAAAEAGADFVGLMFAAESRRRIEIEDAAEIVRALGPSLREIEQETPPAVFNAGDSSTAAWFEHGAAALKRLVGRKRPLTVGVFANNDPEEINEIVDLVGLDLVQLSGHEPWSTARLINRQVINAIHEAADDDAATVLNRIEGGAALAVMLDCAVPGAMGGTGQSFDWTVAAGVAATMPVWLAGGLSPENVSRAIAVAKPWCVDVSSGVETDGVKDVEKIRAFLRAVKGA